MLQKCMATGKAIFPSLLEARYVMFTMKRGYKRNTSESGRRIKHRQGKPAQRRAYFCPYCQGYHLTKWAAGEFYSYLHIEEEKWQISHYISL